MRWIAVALAAFTRPLPSARNPGEAAIVKDDRATRAVTGVEDARVHEQQRDERHNRHGEPRRGATPEDGQNRDAREKQPKAQPRKARMRLLESLMLFGASVEPLPICGLYGRTFPSAFHRYSVRVVPAVSANVSTLSACQSPMLNACDTMRAPGLSCLVRIGRNFRLDADKR
jgi:hypothetical protein